MGRREGGRERERVGGRRGRIIKGYVLKLQSNTYWLKGIVSFSFIAIQPHTRGRAETGQRVTAASKQKPDKTPVSTVV